MKSLIEGFPIQVAVLDLFGEVRTHVPHRGPSGPSLFKATQERFDIGRTGPIGLVEDAAASTDDPTHVGQESIGMVGRPDEVVDEDRAADADFVSEQTGAGELGVKGVMRADPFAGVSLPGI